MDIVIPSISFSAIMPELVLLAVGILILLLDVFSEKHSGKLAYIAVGGVATALFFAMTPITDPSTTFAGLYSADRFTQFFKVIFLIGTGLTLLISEKYAKENNINHGEYYSLILFATVGMMFMAGGADLITIFMGVELMSICLYILAGYTRARMASNEASMKYFLLGAFASGFLLYGMGLIYGITGQTKLVKIAGAISANSDNMMVLVIGAGLMIVGFAFKLAAVPFHQWTPDVYQGAPIPVTAFMSSGPKAAALAAILRVLVEAMNFIQVDWIMWVSVLAIMTMTVGNIAALVQSDIKRMLAFSSISHAGYALVGVSAATSDGVSAVMFYMLVYTFMNIAAFGILALVAKANEQNTSIDAFKGLFRTNPVLAAVMTIMLFSLAGIPPMGGFMAKFYIFMSAVNAGHLGLVLVAVINSAIGAYYYIKVIVAIYFQENPEKPEPVKAGPSLVFALLVSVIAVFVLGLMPDCYLTIAGKALLPF